MTTDLLRIHWFGEQDDIVVSLSDFREANACDPELVSDVVDAFARGLTYLGGGGAQPAYSIAPIRGGVSV